jgi:chaperone modulatory protein CbpM
MVEPLLGELLSEHVEFTLQEVCRICGAGEDTIIEMVREGVVEQSIENEWTFSGVSVARIRTALRLQRDLDVNLAGAALALELLDEIQRLKRHAG